jgi:hypothetical protein
VVLKKSPKFSNLYFQIKLSKNSSVKRDGMLPAIKSLRKAQPTTFAFGAGQFTPQRAEAVS